MARTTITEALAEIKTIDKRLGKKREFVGQYLCRDDQLRDPFERDGGSATVVERELQAIRDLEERRVLIRLRIQEANQRIRITVGEEGRSIAEWLAWRREVAPGRQQFLAVLSRGLAQARQEAQKRGMTVGVGAAVQTGDGKVRNITINVNERELAEQIEQLEEVLR